MQVEAFRILAGLMIVGSILTVSAPAQTKQLSNPEVEARVENLLKQMTLEEKIGQLNQFSAGMPTGPGTGRTNYHEMLAQGQIGSLFNVTTAKAANEFQRTAVEKSRLKIPLVFGLDVIHGFRTMFPVPLAMSATWNPELVERVSRVAAREAAEQGIRWTFSPMVDISRDARWGRIVESAGEDPYLGSVLARAYVRGYQGSRLSDPESVLACAKHFAGYGASEAGRDYNTTDISEHLLRNVYLPPFRAAEQEGVATFMAAFNALNGVPASSNHFLMTQVLRNEWGFDGLITSDWASIKQTIDHGIANDGATAARKSFLAGLDMDMESDVYRPNLAAMVQSGVVPIARVDEAVRRVLRVKFLLGLFENPYADEAKANYASLPQDRLDLAREAAEQSFVLLKNASVNGAPVLPLNAKPGMKIALIGPMADDREQMLGSWSAQGRADDVVTLRTSLQERASRQQMTVLYAKGTEIYGNESGFPEAVQAARQADVAIVALGEFRHHTGEAASRVQLDLQPNQQKLLEAVAATGKPVILLLFNGRPLTINWAVGNVPAILEAWFPGVQAGPALVRALFGDVNPSGRLTATFPRAVGQEPMYYNALSTGRPLPPYYRERPQATEVHFSSRYIDESNDPLFPFGYGLSYTTFSYSNPTVSASSVSAKALNSGGAPITVRAEIRNTGTRPGTEIAQLYIRLRGTSVARPVRELKGFQRLTLAAGESRQVEFKLGREELAFWNIDMKEVVEPAAMTVWVAPDSSKGTPVEVKITE